jgi:AcrR family transcriptional regulator
MSSSVSRGDAVVVPLSEESTRRRLSSRQARTVQKLTAAAVEELRAVGYDGLTVRNVARRAGVAPATAYTYFASREHLVTEVFWRRLSALPETAQPGRRSPAGRAAATLADIALLVADEPELAAACTVAMLASDPDVKHLRDRIGAEVHRRIRDALGADAMAVEVTTIELAVFGALVQAGTGHLSYGDLPQLLAEVVDQVVGGRR